MGEQAFEPQASPLAAVSSPPEKIVEEVCPSPQAAPPEIGTCNGEEKAHQAMDSAENEEDKGANREMSPSTVDESSAASFTDESYHVKDLKESEKKALLELKAKIEEAIKSNTLLPPIVKPEETREADAEQVIVEVVKEVEGERILAEEVKHAGETEAGPMSPPADNLSADTMTVLEVVDEAVLEESVPKDVEEDVTDVALPAGSKEAAKEEGNAPPLPAEEASPLSKTELPDDLSGESSSREVAMQEDESPCLENLSLWGIPLLHSKGDERTDVILLKFLRARDFKVDDALGMLKDTMTWRNSFEADTLLNEECTSEYESVAYMHGLDKEGHPVCYNHYGVFQDKELYSKTFGDKDQFNKFLRWRIQVLEKGIKELDFSAGGVHSMVQITDLKDSPGLVKRRNITKKVLNLLQDNYPELVAKQVFINVPWYFGALYSLYGKIVTPRSKSKVVVARPGGVTETLFKYISPENVPLQYGGFSRPSDTEFGNVEAPVKEVLVRAGEKQTIELPVTESGRTLMWDITVAGWEVVYGEEFIPSKAEGYTVIVQKPKRLAAAEEPLRNSFKTSEPGRVVLTIDNSGSRKKRVAVYRYMVKEEC